MNIITDPLELLLHIQAIFPTVTYLAEDKNGSVFAYIEQPITAKEVWSLSENMYLAVSSKFTRSLIWKSEDWKERIVTTEEI